MDAQLIQRKGILVAINVFYAPKITLISKPVFMEPEHLPVKRFGESSDGEKLVEYAGRICYLSQSNPANRTTAEYIENIKKQGHGSVTEMAHYSLLIEGISRSCSHELVRHRMFNFSQLSQRYVDESECAFVIPPALIGDKVLENQFVLLTKATRQAYKQLSDDLFDRHKHIDDKVLRRKVSREAARHLLPNSTETKIVVTGNVRAWRNFLELRCSLHAEQEIRRLAIMILGLLKKEAGSLFSDFAVNPADNTATSSYKKI